MQVQAVNQLAVRKYSEFSTSLSMAETSLAGLELLIKKANDPNKKFQGPNAVTKDELLGMHKRAVDSLEILRAAARKYQVELQSKGWRV